MKLVPIKEDVIVHENFVERVSVLVPSAESLAIIRDAGYRDGSTFGFQAGLICGAAGMALIWWLS